MYFRVQLNIRNKIISTIFQRSSKPEHLTALWHFLSHYQTSKYHRYSVKLFFWCFMFVSWYISVILYFITKDLQLVNNFLENLVKAKGTFLKRRKWWFMFLTTRQAMGPKCLMISFPLCAGSLEIQLKNLHYDITILYKCNNKTHNYALLRACTKWF